MPSDVKSRFRKLSSTTLNVNTNALGGCYICLRSKFSPSQHLTLNLASPFDESSSLLSHHQHQHFTPIQFGSLLLRSTRATTSHPYSPPIRPRAAMSQSQPGQGQQIDLTTLSTQQLSQLQSRLSQELEHLTQSYARLRQAQGRFRDCIRAIQEGVQGK